MSVAGSAIGAHAGMITDMGAMVASANGPTVLALPWGEMLIFAAVSLLALAAVVYVVVAALRGRLRPGRALFAVLIAVFIPIIGAVLVVWIVAAEARFGGPARGWRFPATRPRQAPLNGQRRRPDDRRVPVLN